MTLKINNDVYEINKYPDTCPACGKGIQPVACSAHGIDIWRLNEGLLQVVYLCPRQDCNRLFIANYINSSSLHDTLFLNKTYILDLNEFETFPPSILQISPNFSSIYNQSKIAEDNGLSLIAGPGYRKALEFLIKDYLIKTYPSDAEEIKRSYLGQAIKKIEEKRIEACASRAAWVGNDETHYVRKWEDKDIQDLKNLIKMVVDWIDLVQRSNEYEEAMPSEAPSEK